MIEASARDDWSLVSAKLKPFIAQRVAPSGVEDVLQDVFLRMHRGLSTLQDEERFGAWVYQIARSAISEHHRTSAKHPLTEQEVPEDETYTEEEDREASRELASCMTLFVVGLPSPYREAITLTELEGLTQREAADMIGISLAAMKSRVLRGRAKLRENLEACCAIAVDARGKVISYEPRPELLADCCPTPLTQISKPR
jgi:RNA polymerase sigma-70 factor, ECF subfamily